ncbi:hypothetical protein [Massilia cavernae]|uniref:Uncharacterized protein n=1 Tax=Massilia cavernae TaxID=2320864 RepID=A0A418XY12_9BURK|nr:hypothetical protein [Massilia cavernae]RJG17867.1 hypothetical protein D3872_09830 [Massilia cavernae]
METQPLNYPQAPQNAHGRLAGVARLPVRLGRTLGKLLADFLFVLLGVMLLAILGCALLRVLLHPWLG